MDTLDRRYDKAAKEMEKREFYPQGKGDDSYEHLNMEFQRRQIPSFGPGFPFPYNPSMPFPTEPPTGPPTDFLPSGNFNPFNIPTVFYSTGSGGSENSLPKTGQSAKTSAPYSATLNSHGSSAAITPVVSPTTHGTTNTSGASNISISGITSISDPSQTFGALSGSQSSTSSVQASDDNNTTTGIPKTTFAAIITVALFVALISAVAAYVSFKKYRKHEKGRVELLDGNYISTISNALPARDGSFDSGQPPMRINRGSVGVNSNNASRSRISLVNAAAGGAVVSTAAGQRESHNEPPSSADDEGMESSSNPFGDHASISNIDGGESALTESSARASDMTLNIEEAFPMPPTRSFDVSGPESTKEDDD